MQTPYFTIKELTEGVYAALAIPGKGAMSNSGIIDLGNGVLVVDTFTTPSAARALKMAAEELTQKKVKYVFNTHYHGDHTFGNQVFQDEAVIISTPETKNFHVGKNIMRDLRTEKEDTMAYINQLQNRLLSEQDPVTKCSVENQWNEMRQVFEAIDELKIVPPSILFEEKLVIEGNSRTVVCYCFGGGHTPSDAIIYLPKEKILFAGDLVLERLHPPIFDSISFINNLERIAQLEIEKIVTGHGGIVLKEHINIMIDYLRHLKDTVERTQDVSQLTVPIEYSDWLGVDGYKRNIRTISNELSIESMKNGEL